MEIFFDKWSYNPNGNDDRCYTIYMYDERLPTTVEDQTQHVILRS